MLDLARRWLPLALLAALLATAAQLSARTSQPDGAAAGAALAPEEALARHGFVLREVSAEAGIDFVHQGPTFDAKLEHIMPQVASMGAAVSVADFDRDGWHDLYVTNSAEGSHNRLYRNLGDGTFEDVAGAMGVADLNQLGTGVSAGAIWGDYDGDGFEDLLVYKWGRSVLFHNDGGEGFTALGDEAGLPTWANLNAAVWLDYDRDGHLDLFLGGYFDERVDLWNLESTRMMPESFEYADNGGRKHLLRNNGDGTFEDVAEALGLTSRRWALAAAAADLRGTGYPDIVIANDYGVSEYWLNEGGTGFRDVGPESGVGYRPKSGMNVSFGDIFNSGRLAIYTTNISEEGVLLQGNNLFVPREGTGGPDAPATYDNMAAAARVELGGWSFGAQFGDLNNDGRLDLALTNGYVSANPGRSYWYDFSKVAGGNEAIISDAANWPPMGDMSLAGYQQKRLWLGDGAGGFYDVAAQVGMTHTHDGRAVALADLWNRGALDVIVAHQRGPLLVYRNEVAPERAWIGFDLQGEAGRNPSAIGARVTVVWPGGEQVQEVSGASGFCAQNMRPLHFGLGEGATVERAIIRWPSGAEQTLEAPAVGQVHRIVEPDAAASAAGAGGEG